MTDLKIASNLSLPIDALMNVQAMVANRGRGKTYAAGKLMEEAIRAEVQSIAIDPTGVWWGLQSSASGKGPGIDVMIMGGEHANVPLEKNSGEIVAQFIVESGQSVVLDLSLFRNAPMYTFMAAFLDKLFHLKARGRYKTALHIFWDETEKSAPQKPGPGQLLVLGAAENCVKLGRSRGFGMTLITQRPATLNKNLLELAEVYYIFGIVGKRDRAAVLEQVAVHADDETMARLKKDLASLRKGECYVWSPTLEWPDGHFGIFRKIKVAKKRTFDSSRTPSPGEKRVEPTVRRKVDLAKLSAEIKASADRVKVNDPKHMRKTIAERDRRICELEKAAERPDEKAAGVSEERIAEIVDVEVKQAVQSRDQQWREIVEGVRIAVREKVDALLEVTEKFVPDEMAAPVKVHPRSRPHAPTRPKRQVQKLNGNVIATRDGTAPDKGDMVYDFGSRDNLSPSERDVLDAIATFPDGATRQRVSIYSGRSKKSSSFTSTFPALEKLGLIEKRGDLYVITKAGAALADGSPGATYREWLGKITPTEQVILKTIVDAHPNALTRAEVSEISVRSPLSSSFTSAFPALRSLGLIEGQSEFAATEELMETV